MSTENKGRLSIKEMQELIYELGINTANSNIIIDNMDTVNKLLNYFGVTQDGTTFIYNDVIIPFIVIYSGSLFAIFHPVDEYDTHTMTVEIISEYHARDMLRSNIYTDGISVVNIERLVRHLHDALYYTKAMIAAMEEISDANTHIFWLYD